MKLPQVGDIISWNDTPYLVYDIQKQTPLTLKVWMCYNLLTGNVYPCVDSEFKDYHWERLA